MIRKHDVARLRSHLGLSRGAVSLILRFLMATPQKQIPIINMSFLRYLVEQRSEVMVRERGVSIGPECRLRVIPRRTVNLYDTVASPSAMKVGGRNVLDLCQRLESCGRSERCAF